MQPKPLLVLLNEGIRGHMVQSRGIRDRLAEMTPLESMELDVPRLTGWNKIKYMKLLARRLPGAGEAFIRRWLAAAGGTPLVEQISMQGNEERPRLFLAAGSAAAPYCLALARLFKGKSCVIMTPSVLGTKPFDMAIVPRHDGRKGPNVLVTLGAPNTICPQLLEQQKQELLADYPSYQKKAWGVLIGGDDINYSIAPLWVNKVFPALLEAAARENADLYITTSRRTQAATEAEIAKLCADTSVVRMLLLASQDLRNPVPGILGHCSKIFCTEDSVSMISEAATAGRDLAAITVGHHHGFRRLLQEITEHLADIHILPVDCLWGVPRFNRMIEDFENSDYLVRITPRNLEEDLQHFLQGTLHPTAPFDESSRAARWIMERWLS